MALPPAQLGQLPSLNMPSHVPTIQTTKEPKAWERALLSILANTASNVIGQGVSNSMERDNAAEFGAAPASGFDKFWHGAAVDDKSATERRTRAADDKKFAATERSNRLDRMQAGTRMNQQASSDLNRQATDVDRLAAEIERGRGSQDIELERVKSQQAHDRVQQLIAELARAQQGRVAEADIGLKGAQTANYQSEAAQRNAQTAAMQSALAGTTKTGPQPTSALQRFASGTNPAPSSPSTGPSSIEDQLRTAIAQGVAPEAALAQAQQITGRQDAVQQRVGQMENRDQTRQLQQALAVAQLMSMLATPQQKSINEASQFLP